MLSSPSSGHPHTRPRGSRPRRGSPGSPRGTSATPAAGEACRSPLGAPRTLLAVKHAFLHPRQWPVVVVPRHRHRPRGHRVNAEPECSHRTRSLSRGRHSSSACRCSRTAPPPPPPPCWRRRRCPPAAEQLRSSGSTARRGGTYARVVFVPTSVLLGWPRHCLHGQRHVPELVGVVVHLRHVAHEQGAVVVASSPSTGSAVPGGDGRVEILPPPQVVPPAAGAVVVDDGHHLLERRSR